MSTDRAVGWRPVRVGRWTVGQLGLRLVVVLGPAVALLATGPAGRTPPPELVAVTLALSAGHALWPESSFGAGTALVVLGWWAAALGQGLPGWSLVAAAALLAAHLAALVAAYGPAELPVDPQVAFTWAGRGVALLAAAALGWLAARALAGQPAPASTWALGVAAVTVGVAVAAVAYAGRGAGTGAG